ncbi:hypothetical protein roselon_00158 [Roseibacterium elongatum DSM 19469]|uniref:Uncharacterized protein n=1 Tax=Roseicyclus elongatus DSM 19469 TaxID=1294273 RepID=W8SJD4_9RHOB|nr:hypothetical protein [Roseibacterium elongatum]AHM02615.1 hypothetical protein roselon_00158 [Roseibacterium elongatum DSM 19469]
MLALVACQAPDLPPVSDDPRLGAAEARTESYDTLARSEIAPLTALCAGVAAGDALPTGAEVAALGFATDRPMLGNVFYSKRLDAQIDGRRLRTIRVAINPDTRRCNVTLMRLRGASLSIGRRVVETMQARGYTPSQTADATEVLFTRGAIRIVMTAGDGAEGTYFGFNPAG